MGQMRVRRTGPWVKISCPFSWVQFIPLVGHGVGQCLTHILTHTFFSVFATKKHRKPKFSMLFGAGGVTRTHDLLITKCIGVLRLAVFRAFGAFLSGVLRTSAPSVPLLPSTRFVVWVTVWVKRTPPRQRNHGQASPSYFVLPFLARN